MASLVQSQVAVPLSAGPASESLCAVLQELGYSLGEGSVPGDSELIFDAKRTVLYTRRQGGAQITPSSNGSTIELGLDVAPGEATGLMDGKRNRKLMDELTARIKATLGSA